MTLYEAKVRIKASETMTVYVCANYIQDALAKVLKESNHRIVLSIEEKITNVIV